MIGIFIYIHPKEKIYFVLPGIALPVVSKLRRSPLIN